VPLRNYTLTLTPEIDPVLNGDNSRILSNILVTSYEVFGKIMKFKDGKAPTDDGIIPEFL